MCNGLEVNAVVRRAPRSAVSHAATKIPATALRELDDEVRVDLHVVVVQIQREVRRLRVVGPAELVEVSDRRQRRTEAVIGLTTANELFILKF